MVTSNQSSPTNSIPFIREAPLIGSLPAFMQDRLGFLLHMAEEGDACGFHSQHATFTLVPGQHIEPDPVHNLALRPAGKVEVVVQRYKN